MSLARERLHKAFILLRERDDKQEGLAYAFKDQLLRLRMEDFPPELRKDFADLVARMCKSGIHNRIAQVRQLDDSISGNEIDLVVEMMAALYINVSCRSPNAVNT